MCCTGILINVNFGHHLSLILHIFSGFYPCIPRLFGVCRYSPRISHKKRPGIRFSKHNVLIRRSLIPHFSDISFNDKYLGSIVFFPFFLRHTKFTILYYNRKLEQYQLCSSYQTHIVARFFTRKKAQKISPLSHNTCYFLFLSASCRYIGTGFPLLFAISICF